jgi:hypothetical protein
VRQVWNRFEQKVLDVLGADNVIADLAKFTDTLRLDGVDIVDVTVTDESFEAMCRVFGATWPRGTCKGRWERRLVMDLPTGPVRFRPVTTERGASPATPGRRAGGAQCSRCGDVYQSLGRRIKGLLVCARCRQEERRANRS